MSLKSEREDREAVILDAAILVAIGVFLGIAMVFLATL